LIGTPPSASPALVVEGMSKHFGGVHALREVSLGLVRGETLGLIGPNGSGKTTLVNCLSGVLTATAGRVELEGGDISRWSRPRRARNGLIRTYQNLRLFSQLTAAENVEAGLLSAGRSPVRARRQRVHDALAEQGIAQLERVRVSDLAYGEQRRVEIARALVGEPRVLVLDEPAAGLGAEETALLTRSLRAAQQRLGFAMLIIDHDVSLIMDISNRVVVLHEGRVLTVATPAEVVRDPAVIAVYLGGGVDDA
jgi:ABC-type branched-subunit amino acid transport system ATPase component